MAQAADRLVDRALGRGEACEEQGERLVEKTLNGLGLCCRLIPRQQAMVVAARARLQLDRLLLARGERFARFLQLRRVMRGKAPDELFSEAAPIYLNPVCSWERITSGAAGESIEGLSGSVLFFLADDAVRGLRMNLEGQVLINELADYHPCSASQWAHLSALADLPQLKALVQHLSEIGLVALDMGAGFGGSQN